MVRLGLWHNVDFTGRRWEKTIPRSKIPCIVQILARSAGRIFNLSLLCKPKQTSHASPTSENRHDLEHRLSQCDRSLILTSLVRGVRIDMYLTVRGAIVHAHYCNGVVSVVR